MMHKSWLCAFWFFSVACGNSAGELREWKPEDHQPPPAVAPEGQGRPSEGEEAPGGAVAALWDMRCASCHGLSGGGDGPGRPPGASLPDFRQATFQAQRTDAQLAEVIVSGRGLMPAFGPEITAEGIAALVKHIRSLQVEP